MCVVLKPLEGYVRTRERLDANADYKFFTDSPELAKSQVTYTDLTHLMIQ